MPEQRVKRDECLSPLGVPFLHRPFILRRKVPLDSKGRVRELNDITVDEC